MAKSLGSIPYRQPPSPNITTNPGNIGGIAKALAVGLDIKDRKDTSAAVAEADLAVQDVFNDVQGTTVDDVQPMDITVTDQQFADQYKRLRNAIKSTEGSAGLALLKAKRVFQARIDSAGPRLRRKLLAEYQNFVNSDPELQQLDLQASQAEDSQAQEWLDRQADISYTPFKDGGYGISTDITLGSLEWARQYRIQKAKRAELDSNIEQALILDSHGALDGPNALIATAKIVASDSGVVQGFLRDMANELQPIIQARTAGTLDPDTQWEWENSIKPGLLLQINKGIKGIGASVLPYWTNNPTAMRDRESFNEAQDIIKREQDNLIAFRDALAKDDFSIVEALETQSFLRGERGIDGIPSLRILADTLRASPGIFTTLKEAGFTGDFKGVQAATEEGRAKVLEELYGYILGATGDDLPGGGTSTATDPEDYSRKAKNAKTSILPSSPRAPAATVKRAKDVIDSVVGAAQHTKGEHPFDFTSNVQVGSSLTTFGKAMQELSEQKTYISDGGDIGRIRNSFSDPALGNLFLAAVKLDLPGVMHDGNQFDAYMREVSDPDDLDSWTKWQTDLAEKVNEPVRHINLADNVLELIRPVEFDRVQNKGVVEYIIDEKKVEAAVRASLKQRNVEYQESYIRNEINQATNAAKTAASKLSREVTTALHGRHNYLILMNRFTKPDYLQALLDPDFGLGALVPLDEDIVYNDL